MNVANEDAFSQTKASLISFNFSSASEGRSPLRAIPVVNSSRRLERFSDKFTPFAPRPISAVIWVRGNGVKSLKRFQSIVEEAQRE